MEAPVVTGFLGVLVGWTLRGLFIPHPVLPAAAPCHCHCACECVDKGLGITLLSSFTLVLAILGGALAYFWQRPVKTVTAPSPKGSGKDKGVLGVSGYQLSLLR